MRVVQTRMARIADSDECNDEDEKESIYIPELHDDELTSVGRWRAGETAAAVQVFCKGGARWLLVESDGPGKKRKVGRATRAN